MHPDEQLLTIAQAVSYYPKGTAVATIIRHITHGVKTPNGRVYLEASRIGWRWVTTAVAIERFREACTNRAPEAPRPTSSSRKASQKRAADFLQSLGMK